MITKIKKKKQTNLVLMSKNVNDDVLLKLADSPAASDCLTEPGLVSFPDGPAEEPSRIPAAEFV